MKYIKRFEQKITLSDIPRINTIKNEKFLKILEFYLCFDSRYVELDIPIDLYYSHNIFSKEKKDNFRHFYCIKGIWSSIRNKDYSDDPKFLISVFSEELVKIDVPDWLDCEERLIIRDDEKNKIIIDILYDYVMNHQEVIQASKFNI